MAYNGAQWDEANPNNNTLANEIDDVARDTKIGVRGRMAQEHIWPASQAATAEGGLHKFVSFSAQTAPPDLVVGTNTQVGALYVTTGNLVFINSASVAIPLIVGTKMAVVGGTAAEGSLIYATSGGAMVALAPSSSGSLLSMVGSTAPGWVAPTAVTFGTWAGGYSEGNSYQATSDGFVTAAGSGGNNGGGLLGYSDASNPPTTLRVRANGDWGSWGAGLTMPVRKDDYWKVVMTGDVTSVTLQWLPMGT